MVLETGQGLKVELSPTSQSSPLICPSTITWLPEPRVFLSHGSCAARKTTGGLLLEIGCEFPSETEARAYITALGYGHFAGV